MKGTKVSQESPQQKPSTVHTKMLDVFQRKNATHFVSVASIS